MSACTNTVTGHRPIIEYDFFKRLCGLPFVEKIYLYGSRARGDADEISDYDLAIECPEATAEEWHGIQTMLDEASFLNKIDSIRYDALEEGLLKSQINKYKKLLYAKH